MWNIDFSKKPRQSAGTLGSVAWPLRIQNGSLIAFGAESFLLALAHVRDPRFHSIGRSSSKYRQSSSMPIHLLGRMDREEEVHHAT
jgi:hypothetical protein